MSEQSIYDTMADREEDDRLRSLLAPVRRLSRDERAAAVTLTSGQARFLVDYYYQMQRHRIASSHQSRTLEQGGEPNEAIDWLGEQSRTLEDQVRGALGRYALSTRQGRWAMSQTGVGPVIAAGMLARLELRPTVGAWWRLAGLDPTVRWGKGAKRPWNASLKRLCWILGDSFTKQSGRESCFYGHIYRQRKEYETPKNLRGDYAEQAARQLAQKTYGKTTDAYKSLIEGRLPPAQINLRAQRYAVKLFLSHLHAVWHEVETGEKPPKPYVIAALGHAHLIDPPGWPCE